MMNFQEQLEKLPAMLGPLSLLYYIITDPEDDESHRQRQWLVSRAVVEKFTPDTPGIEDLSAMLGHDMTGAARFIPWTSYEICPN
jgi:hypothetical protein